MAPRKSKPAANKPAAAKPTAKPSAGKETAAPKAAPAISAQNQDPVAQQPAAQQPLAQPGTDPNTVSAAAPLMPPASASDKPDLKADPPAVSDQLTGVVMSPLRHDGMAFAIGDPIALEASVFAGLEKAGVVKPD